MPYALCPREHLMLLRKAIAYFFCKRSINAPLMSITNQIRFNNLQGDIFGGVTAAIVSLPLALAFGVASGIGPIGGLYGAICVGFFAALFGGTPTLISEPTGPMTVVMTAIVASLTASNPEQGLPMAFTVVMLAGLFQIIKPLPRAVFWALLWQFRSC